MSAWLWVIIVIGGALAACVYLGNRDDGTGPHGHGDPQQYDDQVPGEWGP